MSTESLAERKRRPHRYDASLQGHKLTIAYRGTDFAGWQIQPGKRTVQQTIEDAIAKDLGAKNQPARFGPHRHRRACAGSGRVVQCAAAAQRRGRAAGAQRESAARRARHEMPARLARVPCALRREGEKRTAISSGIISCRTRLPSTRIGTCRASSISPRCARPRGCWWPA